MESGTEHAQFRQYSQNQGRWLTMDPYLGSYDFTNPQSLNRYAYVLNNPVSLIDPSGLHIPVGEGGGGSDCANDSVCTAEGGSNGDSGFWGDPWGGPPTSALGALAQQQEIWWALFTTGPGGSPLYGYGFGGLYQYSWLFTPNPDYVYTDAPNLDDGDPTASDGTFSPYLAFVGPISSGAVIAGPGNGSSFAPNNVPPKPAPPQGNSWSHPLTPPTCQQWKSWGKADAYIATSAGYITKQFPVAAPVTGPIFAVFGASALLENGVALAQGCFF